MITLSHKELALYRSCLNEVLRGFWRPDMERIIGASYAALMKEDARLATVAKSSASADSMDMSTLLRPQVVAEAIRQIGPVEFHTHTGHSLEDGDRLLRKVENG